MKNIAIPLIFMLCSASAADWPHWRGPSSNGIAPSGSDPPLTWDDEQNIVWRTHLPGRGHGSPTIVGNRIYLATAEVSKKEQSVLAIDRSSGEIVWQTPVFRNVKWPEIHNKNTHASSTVACDGKFLFVSFYSNAKIRLASLDLDGKLIWQKDVAEFKPKYPFGYAASPVLYGNLVIATAESQRETALVAYYRETGREVWRAERPQNSSYSSPVLLNVSGKDQLLMLGGEAIRSYDPESGKENWSAKGAAKHTAGTVTGEGNLVIGSGGYPQSDTFCVRADGTGNVLWRNQQKCYEQSMLIHRGFVYAINDNGIAFCWDASDGAEKWKKRLAGPVSSSPILVGDRIYVSNELGSTFVFRANPKRFELLAENKLGDDIFPTPAFLDGRIYMRLGFGNGDDRHEELLCIGEK